MNRFILVSAFSNITVTKNSRMSAIFNHIDGEITVLTTDFNHRKKKYYEAEEIDSPYQVNLHVPTYKSNISIKRVWSHIIFAKQVRKYLMSLSYKPQAIYCTAPTSSSAYICAKYCRKNGIKFVLDVIDLWPDSLLPLVKGKSIFKAILFPWNIITHYAYRNADVIIGESVKYANEAKRFNNKAEVYPVYLGVDVDYINTVYSKNSACLSKPENEIWIGYAGSLGESYDFDTLLKAVKSIHDKYNYKLWLIGDGNKRSSIEKTIKRLEINAEITGFLTHEQLLGYLSYCDIAVNIFRENTKVVYSYKFNDYVATNCFVLNSLEGETADMVEEYRIGKNFDFRDNSLDYVLDETLLHWGEYSKWKDNAKRLIEEKLDKNKIYSIITDIFK